VPTPDLYGVATDIIIPSVVGVISLVIAGVAVGVSRSAAKTARTAEENRAADHERALRREDRQELLAQARHEARILVEWVHEARRPKATLVGWGSRSRETASSADTESLRQRLRREAHGALTVSSLPGADLIYALTEHDLRYETRLRPYDSTTAAQYNDVFDRRTTDRIRDWAHDPEAAVPALHLELDQAQSAPRDYAQVPLGIGWEDIALVEDDAGESN